MVAHLKSPKRKAEGGRGGGFNDRQDWLCQQSSELWQFEWIPVGQDTTDRQEAKEEEEEFDDFGRRKGRTTGARNVCLH